MRKLIALAAVSVALTACEFDFSTNGDLDGFWQMTSIDTIATGGTKDMYGSKIYWGVQKKILEIRKTPELGIQFNFDHSGSKLSISNPYVNDRDSGDIKVTDVSLLQPMGVNKLDESFDVLELSSGTMTLQSEMLRLHFRRY